MNRIFFAIHATIWDVALLLVGGGFVVLYFIIWATEAWKANRRNKQ